MFERWLSFRSRQQQSAHCNQHLIACQCQRVYSRCGFWRRNSLPGRPGTRALAQRRPFPPARPKALRSAQRVRPSLMDALLPRQIPRPISLQPTSPSADPIRSRWARHTTSPSSHQLSARRRWLLSGSPLAFLALGVQQHHDDGIRRARLDHLIISEKLDLWDHHHRIVALNFLRRWPFRIVSYLPQDSIPCLALRVRFDKFPSCHRALRIF